MGISRSRRNLYLGAFCLFALARVFFAAKLPVLGDEAYYISWGRELRALYYDQPPMIGWWLWALQKFSLTPLWLRLPVLLIPTLLGFLAIYRLQNSERAWLGALLSFCGAMVTIPMVMTTDVPLVLFTVLAVGAICAAIVSGGKRWFAVAGGCIGLGFLSKYFIVLLIPAYFLHAVFFTSGSKNRNRALRGGMILLAAAAPFAIFHFWANWQDCWANLIFNFSSRHIGESRTRSSFVEFAGFQLLLLSPLLLIPALRSTREVRLALGRPVLSWLALSYAVPVLAFGYSALRHAQGLHWMISFYPGLYFFLGYALPIERLRFWSSLQVGASLVGVVAATALLLAPSEHLTYRHRFFRELKRARELTRTPTVLEAVLAAAPTDAPLLAESYSNAATLSYHLGRPVHQFGNLGKFGRNDDLTFDLSAHAGRDLVYITRGKKSLRQVEGFFRSVESQEIRHGRLKYRVSILRGFNFEAYRDEVLERLRNTYYFEPAGFPPAACSFTRLHFGRRT